MIIDIVTIFPQIFEGVLKTSIIKKAIDDKKIIVNIHNFREFSDNKHHQVDDTTYGGGAGMLIKVSPVANCIKSIPGYKQAHKIITTPVGYPYDQEKAKQLSNKNHIIIVCGHYEGIDDRINNYIDEEISIGDYILTGGEIPALAILDSVSRLIPNVIKEESLKDESFQNDLLEYPQYTKPFVYDGYEVPEYLMNGNHQMIEKYRMYQSLKRTYEKRKDLINENKLSYEQKVMLSWIKEQKNFEDIKNIKIKKLK